MSTKKTMKTTKSTKSTSDRKTVVSNTKKTTTPKASVKTTKTPVATYVPVSNNIYFDGYAYRVRVSVNGTKHDKRFSSKKKAYAFRKELFGTR